MRDLEIFELEKENNRIDNRTKKRRQAWATKVFKQKNIKKENWREKGRKAEIGAAGTKGTREAVNTYIK